VRVLFLSMEYPPETGWGGIGSSVAAVAPALARRGHEVHVLSCVPGQQARDRVEAGVHVHRRSAPPIPLARRVAGWQTAWRLQTALATWRAWRRTGLVADAVEYPDWGAEGLVFGRLARAGRVAHLHTPLPLIRLHNGLGLDRDSRWASALERAAVRRAHVVTAPSDLVVAEVRRLGWLDGRPVRVLPYAVDADAWAAAAPVSTTGPTVVFVGRLEARKAPETLVDAMRVLGATLPEARLVLVGTGSGSRDGQPYAAWVKARADARCRFVDHVARGALPALLGQARVLALPSRFDNFPMAVAEAMAAGRPVVVTRTTGIAELVESAGAGTVVSPGDPAALADALAPFLRDPGAAEAAGEKARRLALERLDPDRIARAREEVYQAAVAAGRR
jgi:glycosyltransferase involved in cell wall biosynthesis